MVLDQAMVTVAGIGCRKGVDAAAIIAALRAAERAFDVTAERLATAPLKAEEDGIVKAAEALSLPLDIVSLEKFESAAARTMTLSWASLAHAGSPSVSEAAALAAAGENARLLAPRLVTGSVTVAIAMTDDVSRDKGRSIDYGEEQ